MASNLTALASFTTRATALSNLILISPDANLGYQPQNLPGETSAQPDAFLFQYEGEQNLSSECDIPDHFLEDNKAYQDQIALKPVMFTTHGFIGELNDVVPFLLKPLKFIADKLTGIAGYEPQTSISAQLAYSRAFQLYQVGANAVNAAVSSWSSISSLVTGDGPVQNKQQLAYQKLFGYQQERRLFTIQTPWAMFQNMAINKLRASQDDETRVISDFEVTFKQMRFATSETNSGNPLSSGVDKFQGQAAAQAAPLTNLGTSAPTPSSTTLSTGISSLGG